MDERPHPLFTIRFEHHLFHHDGGGEGGSSDLPALLAELKEALMSAFSDKLDRLEQAITNAEARVAEDIAELQRRVESGTVTPEEEARFNELIERQNAIDPLPDHPAPEPAPDDGTLPDDGTIDEPPPVDEEPV